MLIAMKMSLKLISMAGETNYPSPQNYLFRKSYERPTEA